MTQASKFVTKSNINYFYTAFDRPHLDYEDILYDQAFNNFFHDRLESVQYNACLDITEAIRDTPKEKNYIKN